MSLKQSLRRSIIGEISRLEKGLIEAREDLEVLKSLNTKKALYIIELDSMWEKEGEQSIDFEHFGELSDSIKKAEGRFKSVNKRQDIQANYTVQVRIGERNYDVPKKYWRK